MFSSGIDILMWSSIISTLNWSLSMWGCFDSAILRIMRRVFDIFMKMFIWWKYWSHFIIATVPYYFLNFNAINYCKCKVPLSEFLSRRVLIIQRKWVANLVGLGLKSNTSFHSKTLVWLLKNSFGVWYFPQKSRYIA